MKALGGLSDANDNNVYQDLIENQDRSVWHSKVSDTPC
jgi:hypothetical protein